MKLLFKQRLFSWFDSYDIYDEAGNILFIVKGALSWGHTLKIYDANNNYLGMIKEEVLTFLPRFKMYAGDKVVGKIYKELSLFRPKFSLDFNGWKVNGNFTGWNYKVEANSRVVAYVSKELFRLTDVYQIDVPRPEDVLYCLMIVLAIDAVKCSQQN